MADLALQGHIMARTLRKVLGGKEIVHVPMGPRRAQVAPSVNGEGMGGTLGKTGSYSKVSAGLKLLGF